MEVLLLWIDELDDAFGVLRHYAPKILGFCIACALFAVTGFVLLRHPGWVLPVAAAVSTALLSAASFEFYRRRRVRLPRVTE